jgi:adenylate kinase family enzyme
MNIVKNMFKPRNSSLLNPQSQFIRRWPKAPKIAVFASPGVFSDEYTKRLSIDLGVPLVSMKQMLETVETHAGHTEEYNHPFFLRVRDMLQAGDDEGIIREKIPLKLLRLSAETQRGFILMDFPMEINEAEMMEEYRGGLNAFVHLSLPMEVQAAVESAKMNCTNCGKVYYDQDVVNQDLEVFIEKFLPSDHGCDECGSKHFEQKDWNDGSAETELIERQLDYETRKGELLAFYNHHGLLVDCEPRRGYADYEKVKRDIQFNCKH